MITITKETLEAVCPAGTMPDDTAAVLLRDYFDNAYRLAEELCSPSVLDAAAAECRGAANLFDRPATPGQRLYQAAIRFTAARGLWEGIPAIDLVLTPNGFGVVSNQNVAPASADRVRALRSQMKRVWCEAYEDALALLRSFPEWHVASPSARLARTLFWHSSHLAAFGVADPTLDDLRQRRPALDAAERRLAELVSPRYLAELTEAEATASATPEQTMIIDHCRRYAAALDTPADLPAARRELLRLLDEAAPAAYIDSPAFKANHAARYENAQDDPCYFF